MTSITPFPFSAIVGQQELKLALILNLVCPSLGGVLISGEKGTAKSTAVRGLTALLPERLVSADCPFSCAIDDPDRFCQTCADLRTAGKGPASVKKRMQVVELPLGATEDRVIGSLDLGHILTSGERRFEPGLLAQANGNLLYVDEINLLEDHIVDVLLDSAAMGINYVEREGVSYSHPARFILVGSMNPEEGDLRPQLLDRFGLSVEVRSESDPANRAEILSRRLAFEADPDGYAGQWASEEAALSKRILTAQALLPRVSLPDAILGSIARAGIRLETDGHRADLALAKASMAHAALRGSESVDLGDLVACAPLALGHRMRRKPFQERGIDAASLKAALDGDASA